MWAFIFFLLFVATAVFAAWLGIERRELTDENQRLEADNTAQADVIERLSEQASRLSQRVARLKKWQNVADADERAQELTSQAECYLADVQRRADQLAADAASTNQKTAAEAQQRLLTASNEAAALRQKTIEDLRQLRAVADTEIAALIDGARLRNRQLTKDAEENLEASIKRSAMLLSDAEKRAQDIGKNAYHALQNAVLYEHAARAMKNAVEGYGDRYLVAIHSMIDELSDEFGHVEAGRELKRARHLGQLMTREGTAGTCNYVETSRSETAVRFVVDAFNGKADSILSRIKSNNAGTLRQEMKDAFALVNLNGRAFRDARVTDEYLAVRLEELKWAAITQQLKLDAKDEQRQIKEQLREEEKAHREYQRAIKEAAREEEMLRKAIEKAQEQISHATSLQRAEYERQLTELSARLSEAESRNQRALSMAQQTRRGHVYIISNIGSFGEDVIKIGLTRRLEPLDRIRELGDSSVPFEFDVHALILSDDAPALEHSLHKHFIGAQVNKVNHRKEFFRVNLTTIRKEVEQMGLDVRWTMAAEARQYRETLAIETAMKTDPELRQKWLNRQLELEYCPPSFDEDLRDVENDE